MQLSRAAELSPDDTTIPLSRADLMLRVGRTQQYEQLCSQLLDRFEGTTDYVTASNIAGLCVKGTISPKDMDRAYKLADFAARATGPEWFLPWMALGQSGIASRRGNFESAIEWANRALNDPNATPSCRAWALHGQAQSYVALSKPAEAQAALARADELISQHNKLNPRESGWDALLSDRPRLATEIQRAASATQP
jgi:tetratricopeptide (TPR) repeat protein